MVFKINPDTSVSYIASFTSLTECTNAVVDLNRTKQPNTEYIMMNGQRYG